jgi:hypothetical protein
MNISHFTKAASIRAKHLLGHQQRNPFHFLAQTQKNNTNNYDLKFFKACVKTGLRHRAIELYPFIKDKVPFDLQVNHFLNCGDLLQVIRLVEHFQFTPLPEKKRSTTGALIACLIAPLWPEKALKLILATDSQAACVAALAKNAGNMALCHELLHIKHKSMNADNWLLKANLEESNQKKTELLNTYLQCYGLSQLTLFDTTQPLSVTNLRPQKLSHNMNQEEPLVTVILTSFNNEKYIEASTRSILRQTHSNLQLIIIDDASEDNTWKYIQALARIDKRISTLRLPQNHGTYVARNIGLTQAKGDFIAFQDADDWSHPERLRHCMNLMMKNKEIVAVTSKYVRLDGKGEFFSPIVWPLTRWTPNSMFFRRAIVLNEIGYFDKVRFGADSEYVARIRAHFGESRHIRLEKPLTIAAHRFGSLMTADDTGPEFGAHSEIRLQHQEEWAEWLLSKMINAEPLYRAP